MTGIILIIADALLIKLGELSVYERSGCIPPAIRIDDADGKGVLRNL